MADRCIRGARVVTDTGLAERDIMIEDGTIAAVGPDAADGIEADHSHDAEGMVALPGVVDVHNHMHDDDLFPDPDERDEVFSSGFASGGEILDELGLDGGDPFADGDPFDLDG
jgi:dihydropyrimidinase/dihydroorotase